MAKLVRRLLIVALIAYLAVLAALFVGQRSLIYPAPQERHAPATGFAEVTLTTSDGLALQAHWRAPDAGRATVVWFHGNGGSLAGAEAETAQFAASGYGVLLVEYRGYGGNQGAPSEQGLYRDGRAAMAFLAARGVTPARAIIGGHSLGTGTATEMARQPPCPLSQRNGWCATGLTIAPNCPDWQCRCWCSTERRMRSCPSRRAKVLPQHPRARRSKPLPGPDTNCPFSPMRKRRNWHGS